LNETTVGFAVQVLVAGRTIQVPALMPLKSFWAHFLLEAVTTATSTKAHGGLRAGGWFARMVLDEMRLEASLSEKVPMTSLATSGGFQTSRVSLQVIRAIFLATGPAKVFSFVASMLSLCVIGFTTVGTHVTGSEKPRQTGDDIAMVFLVEQDQLFVLGVSKRGDMEGPVGIHQDDLVIAEGRCRTEGRQGVVTTRTEGHVGFVVEQQSQFFLQFSSLANAVVFRVLVHSGFGGDEGPGTTEGIVILDADDGF